MEQTTAPVVRKPITEADKVIIDTWFLRARQMKLADLPAFLQEMVDAYQHDYGTICKAIAAAAIAAAWAIEHSPAGGITGFQASCIQWDFARYWMSWGDEPRRLLDYSNMLYPQYADKFQSINTDTWKWLQAKAAAMLAEVSAVNSAPAVRQHWESIVAGVVPFGYAIRD